MGQFFSICFASAIGGGLRHLLQISLNTLAPGLAFYGVLLVNLIGSTLLGSITQLPTQTLPISPELKLILSVGLLGGFTTYSGFNQQAIYFIQHGESIKAALYIAAMLASCLVGGFIGTWLVK